MTSSLLPAHGYLLQFPLTTGAPRSLPQLLLPLSPGIASPLSSRPGIASPLSSLSAQTGVEQGKSGNRMHTQQLTKGRSVPSLYWGCPQHLPFMSWKKGPSSLSPVRREEQNHTDICEDSAGIWDLILLLAICSYRREIGGSASPRHPEGGSSQFSLAYGLLDTTSPFANSGSTVKIAFEILLLLLL